MLLPMWEASRLQRLRTGSALGSGLAYGLRGRRISPSAGIKFGNWAPQFYMILGRNGRFQNHWSRH